MKTRNKVLIVLGIIAIIVIAAVVNRPEQAVDSDNTGLVINEKGIAVSVVSPEKLAISDNIFTIGSVEPSTTFNVTAKVNGNVEKTYFEVGDYVNKDDILFEIESDSFDVSKNATLTQLKNALNQAKSGLDTAEKNLNDQTVLYNSGAISKAQYDSAVTAYDNAKIGYNNALSSYQSNSSSLSDQNDFYTQKSPVSGVVVSKTIYEDTMAVNSVGYTIIPEGEFVIKTSVTSKYVNRVVKDQVVEVYVNTLDKTYEGYVKSVSDVGQMGSYPVEVTIQGDEDLKAGLYAEVTIELERHNDALVIADKALMTKNGETFVYVVDSELKAEKVLVTTGIKEEGRIEILSGLSEGDKVISVGKEYLDEGSLVVIK